MNSLEIIQILLFFGLGIALTPVVGGYMARVFKGERTFLSPLLSPLERLAYRVTGVDPEAEMSWLTYLWAVVIMAILGFLMVFTILRRSSGCRSIRRACRT